MCGIAGYINPNGVSADLLKNMASTMIRRGPDGEGIFSDRDVGLAHRRLSIIDLTGGAQPMSYDGGNLVIVFNGEIFNYREMRDELIAAGCCFETKSDTEVILAMYHKYGSDSFAKLNGFFAFALYDKKNRFLYLVRDRAGIKPLFYFRAGRILAFASTLTSLRKLPFFPDAVNENALREYLAFQYVPGSDTIYRNTARLAPGCFLKINLETSSVEQVRYWSFRCEPKTTLSYEDAKTELAKLIRDSVRRRLISDVPLGVFLSGGLDSAIVTACAAEASDSELNCFSIGFADPRYNESSLAAETADHVRKSAKNGLMHHIMTVDPSDFSVMPELIRELGEPFADASMLPTALLSKFTREKVTVALSGDGADELFGGYERYRAMGLLSKLAFCPGCVFSLAEKLIPDSGERTFSGRLKRFLTLASLPPDLQYRALMTHSADQMLKSIFDRNINPPESFLNFTSLKNSDRYPELDFHTYLPGDILVKADLCSMTHSLEVRSPFLDYRVMDFAAALPFDFKQRGTRRKMILADAFQSILPQGISTRKKRGFGIPVGSWFRSVWRDRLCEHLHSLDERGIFRKGSLDELFKLHLSGKADLSYILFSLMILEIFFQECQFQKY